VIVRSSRSRKHGVYTSSQGKIETTYLGSGVKNRTVTYSKPSNGEVKLRVERRMKPYCRGGELFDLPNPFTAVQMVGTASLIPHLGGMVPEQFFDSVRLRGLSRVLSQLPRKQQANIRSVFKDSAHSMMPSHEKIWAQWPALLHRSGLAYFIGLVGADAKRESEFALA
jgi:hypothetical protein